MDKEPSTLSVVIPVFNEEKNLEELLDRCLKTCGELNRDFEIILVDDGSSDRSREIIQQRAAKHPGKVVGVLLNRKLAREGLTWDQRFEIWLNTFHNRPGLCILHPFVQAPILDVLQAFKDFGPRRPDDYNWMSK